MEPETAWLVRKAQIQSLAETVGLSSEPLLAFAEAHAATLPRSLLVTVDGTFEGLTIGTRSRSTADVAAAKASLATNPRGVFVSTLAADASRVVFSGTASPRHPEVDVTVSFGGAWSVDEVATAWSMANLDQAALAVICEIHGKVAGGAFDLVSFGARRMSLQFEVAIVGAGDPDAVVGVLGAAEACGATLLQLGLLQGMLETWTPRDLNFLTLRLHVEDSGLVPGLDVGFHDIPNDYAILGLQAGRPHPHSGVLFGVVEGVLMPERSAASRFFFQLGPAEPATVTATLESAGVQAAEH